LSVPRSIIRLAQQDYHHDWINPSKLPTPLIMPEILATWNVRGGVRVKQHLSEPRKGAVTIMEKRGHADRFVCTPLRSTCERAVSGH
jgi:UV DNA damage endonuclease